MLVNEHARTVPCVVNSLAEMSEDKSHHQGALSGSLPSTTGMTI